MRITVSQAAKTVGPAIRLLIWMTAIVVVISAALSPLLPDRLYGIPLSSWGVYVRDAIIYPLANFVDRHVDAFLSWPVAVAVISYFLVKSDFAHRLAISAIGRVKSVDVLGFSVELTEQIKELHRERDELFRILAIVQQSVGEELRGRVEEMSISSAFSRLVAGVSARLIQLKPDFQPKCCRATIHIEGVIFADQLLQLLEYVSGDGTVLPGYAAGRTFSVRRGIVGRVWRSHIAEVEGVLPTDSSGSEIDTKEGTRHIAQIWGLTQTEAEHVKK